MKILILMLLLIGCQSLQKALLIAPAPTPTPVVTEIDITEPIDMIAGITSIATASKCNKIQWKNRGLPAKGYLKGMALVYAKAYCHQDAPYVKLVSLARKQPESKYDATDALSWYNSNFKIAGMNNDKDGVDTLRHTFALLIGLGPQESSGKYCCGRDMSASFNSADSAEAGLFQASWGAKRVSPELLTAMFNSYKDSPNLCLLDTFKEGANCSSDDAKSWGDGTGYEWQNLTKSCPAFATEYAAVLLRLTGGTRGEFGPIRKKNVELVPACDTMLKDIQKYVDSYKEVCKEL